MQISVIIPTWKEAANIEKLVQHLQRIRTDELLEIIVTDGGSPDRTGALAEAAGAKVLISPRKGRGPQMNYAASKAQGDVLYFVHADVLPPENCFQDIAAACQAGCPAGCFTYRFDSDRPMLRFMAAMNKIDSPAIGGGDQTLFVKKDLFEKLGGFKDYVIMEDFDFVWRLRKKYPFRIIKNDALVSARKYESNSYLRVQFANLLIIAMFRMNCSQKTLAKTYTTLLR